MMDTNILRTVVAEQAAFFSKEKDFLPRAVDQNIISSPKIAVITGVRRSGKSTLLKQIAREFEGDCYYFNFEDERLLDFSREDFNGLLEIFLELFGSRKTIFFDEIQYIYGWEKFVSRLFKEGYKVFLTGSSANLLSRELGTALTGRHIKMELYPFSFKEFLAFHKVPYGSGPRLLSDGRAAIRRSFKQYLVGGGFPESVAGGADEELRQLYQDMIMKDLIVRFGIRDVRSFRELALYLVSNVGVAISFNNLKKMLGFKSVTTVKNYVDFFEQSYLLFSIFKYDYSLKKQIMNNRKIFSIDTGLSIAVYFSFSDNRGRLLENLVFLELKRRQSEVYYYSDGRTECDFAIKEGTRISAVLQVTESLDKGNREREVAGLIAAARAYSLSEGVIVTLDQEEDFMFDEIKVRVVPAWKWLLE